jgi:hypothetical protein
METSIFKNATEAARQVRRSGQTGIAPPQFGDGDTNLFQRATADAGAVAPPPPRRRALSTPQPQAPVAAGAPVPSWEDFLPAAEPQPAQPATRRLDEGSLLQDMGIGIVRGAVNMGAGLYELAGDINPLKSITRPVTDKIETAVLGDTVFNKAQEATKFLESHETADLAAQRKELHEAKGFVDSFVTVVTNPRLAGSMAMEMVPQLVTVAGAARMAATRTIAAVTEAELAAGATAESAAATARAAATVNATRTVLGLNAASEGGSAGMDARQTVMTMAEADLSRSPQYQKLVTELGDTPDGRKMARERLANDASTFSAAVATSISLISGKITGAGELETKAVTGKVLGSAAGEAATKKTIGATAKGFAAAGVKEVAQESLEEGGSQFGQNVGVRYSGAKPDQDLSEGVANAAGAGGAMGLLAGAGFHAVNEVRGSGDQKKAPETGKETGNNPKAPDGVTTKGDASSFKMTDAEYGQVINHPAFMAAAYMNGDEGTRARLRQANPDLNFDALINDEKALKIGNSLMSSNPQFTDAFHERLNQTPVDTAAPKNTQGAPEVNTENNLSDPPEDMFPGWRDQRKDDTENPGRDNPANRVDNSTPDGAPARELNRPAPVVAAMPTLPGLPNQNTLLQGYTSRAENLMRLPEEYRRQQAEQSVAEMIGRGFSPEDAHAVFAPILNPQEAPAAPAATPEDIRPKLNPDFKSFADMRQEVSTSDKKRNPAAKATDYTEMPVHPRIRELAKVFGVNVVGYRYTGNDKTLKKRRGIALKGNIMLNVDSTEQHLSIFGHEIFHELSRRNPEAAKALQEAVIAYLDRPGITSFKKRLTDVGYDFSKLNEEVAADVLGYLFTENQFWAELNQSQPTLIQKILTVIDDMIEKLGANTGRRAEIAGYIKELDTVRTMLATFVSQNIAPTQTNQDAGQVNESIDISALADNEKATVAQIKTLLREGKTSEAAAIFKASGLFKSRGLKFTDIQADTAPAPTPKGAEVASNEDPQGKLRIYSTPDKYNTEVNQILSGRSGRVKAREEALTTERRADKIQKLEDTTSPDDEEGSRNTLLDNDTGGVMTNMAISGSLGEEGAVLAESNKQTAEQRKAQEERDVEAQKAIMRNRVRSVTSHLDSKLEQLAKIRQRMAAEGRSQSDIDATVGGAESTIKSLRDDEELKALTEQQLADDKTQVERTQPDDKTPEEYPGNPEVQSRLELETQQQEDARNLADAVFKKEMTILEAFRAVRENDIGVMNVIQAFRAKGIEPTKQMIDLSGHIAANNTLRTYVREARHPMMARESWLKSYDNLPNKKLVELTKTEQAAYNEWKARREAIKNRIDDQQLGEGTVDQLFPNALFTQFTLNQMKNLETVPEPMRSVIRDLFDDPVKAWKEDVSAVFRIRPDLEDQIDAMLTQQEKTEHAEYFMRQLREDMRNMEMKVKSPAYSQLDQLKYLSPDLYMKYRAQIGMAEESQLQVILHAANEMNDLAKATNANPEALNDYLNQAMHEDEMLSRNPDEIPESETGEIESIENVLSRFKRGTYSGVVPALTIQEHFETVFSKWENPPAYTVVQNPNQLPDDVRERLTSRFATNDFKGALDPKTGHIYVFSDFVHSTEDAEFTMFHELYGHWGMRAFLGDKINGFLETQYRLNKQVKAEADRQLKQAEEDGMPMTKLESVEEAISDMAANGDPNLFREMVGRLVAWLRKSGMTTVADWMDSSGNSELAYILGQARKIARTGQGISPLSGAPQSVLYSRDKRPKEMFAVRDGDTAGYARLNPINNQWTVFTIQPDGTFGAISVQDTADAYNILKKVGAIAKSRAESIDPNRRPEDLVKIPDYTDLTGWAKLKRNLQIGMQNSFLPVFEVARFLESKGMKNTVIDDLIKYESRLKYYVDDYNVRYLRPITQSLAEAGKKGATVEDIDLFLMARHAEERNGVIATINAKNSAGSGISTSEARKIMSTKNGGKWDGFMAEMEKIGKLTDQMSSDKISYMFQTGLINKYQLASLNKYKHYVNLSGNQDLGLDAYDTASLGGKSFNLKGAEFIRSTGRGTQAIDVLQNTMNSYLAALIRGQKNRPVTAILNMARQNPDPTYVVIDPIKEKKRINLTRLAFDKKILSVIGDKMTEASGRLFLQDIQADVTSGKLDMDDALDRIEARMREAADRRDISGQEAATAIRNLTEQVVTAGVLSPDGYVTMVEDNSLMHDPAVIVAKENGVTKVMRFNKRAGEFVQAVTGMNSSERSGFLEVIGAWNRFFSQMVTSWNPGWIPVNGIRDIQTAIANMAADPDLGPKMAAKMTAEWRKSLQTAFRYQVADQAQAKNGYWGKLLKSRSKKHPIDPAEAQLYKEYREDGAETFFLDRDGLELTLEKMNRHINGPQGLREMTEAKLEAIGDFMELFSMPMETAPRFAAYKVMREAGKSREEAARYAKELTINFNMKGKWRELRSLYAFFNPAVQGTYRMFQNYSRSETGKGKYLPSNQFMKVAGMWMLFGMAANMMARALGGKDDDKPGIDKLDMIPNYRRSTSLVIIPDAYGGAIPVAYGWNVFMTAGSNLFDAWTGKVKPEVAASRVMNAAFDAFAPIGSGAESKTLAGSVEKMFAPTPLVPLAELNMNENRFGAPIYKESQYSNVKESDAYMHFNSVNPISKALMHGLAKATSGGRNPRFNEALIDVNPATVDHLIGSYLPGLFSEAYKTAGFAVQASTGANTKEQALPLVERFRAKIPEGFDNAAFRRVAEDVNTRYREYMAGDTTDKRRAELRKDYKNLGGMQAMMAGIDHQIRSMNESLKALETNPKISDSDKVAYRNKVENDTKTYRNRAVKEAIKAGFRNAVIDNTGVPVVDQSYAIINQE